MENVVFVYVTNPSREKAREIAHHLLEKRLIACANIFPIDSLYRWEGKLVDDSEYVLIGKTLESRYAAVVEEIERIHPYSVPCVVKIPAAANRKYFEWLKGEVDG